MKKKIINKKHIIFGALLIGGLIFAGFTLAETCPALTTVSGTTVTFVGELTDMGGDATAYGWFEYGQTTSYGQKTSEKTLSQTGAYCITASGLSSCTTYHYRAVARNSAGTSYGEHRTFTTTCGPTVDIKANGSDGPIEISYNNSATLTWTSSNANYCSASGNWSGSKSTSGSQSTGNLISLKTYILTCTNSGGSASDSVTVNVTSQNNQPPTANAGPDKEVYEEESVRLDGSGYDPDGDPITYYWSCTGGYLSDRYTSRPTFDAPSVSYDRDYTCTLRVTDDGGLSDSDSMRVRVLNQEEEEEVCSKSDSSCSNPDGYMYLGDERTGCLNNGDWKYYKVRESSGKRVEVELSWSGTGCNVNDLIIYSSGCSQIYSEENNSWTKTWEGTPSSDIVIGLDGDSSNKDCRWNLRVTGGEEGELSVKKSVKNVSRGDTEWYNIYRSANPSEELIFKIVVKSTGDTEIRDVEVRDTLPSKIIYQGNLEIDGVSKTKDITETTVNIGDLSPGESKTITFEAKVAAKENFSYGTTDLINSARAYTDEISETDTCKVKVTRKKVAGVVTGVSNGILDSILLPLGIALAIVWVFKSKFIGLDKWAGERKKEIGEHRAKKTLKRKISQLKTQGYFKN